MFNVLTFPASPLTAVAQGDGLWTSLRRRLAAWSVPSARDAAEDLMALASDYEGTQPSFAADLRAAARQHLGPRA